MAFEFEQIGNYEVLYYDISLGWRADVSYGPIMGRGIAVTPQLTLEPYFHSKSAAREYAIQVIREHGGFVHRDKIEAS